MPYSEEEASFFFGREQSQQIIISNLMASPLTILYGGSGVGKSSVLRAGVAYRLRQLAEHNLREYGAPELAIVMFSSWRTEPLKRLKQQIAADIKAIHGIEDSFTPPSSTLSFVETLRAWTQTLGTVEEPGELLIILDQFEEYFLYHDTETGEDTFATEFPRAVNSPSLSVNFLISVREDSLSKLDRFKHSIPNIFDNRLKIHHLDQPSARTAIIKPVKKFIETYSPKLGLDLKSHDLSQLKLVDPALVEIVLQQVSQIVRTENGKGGVEKQRSLPQKRIEAPYLQLVMTRLWQEEMGLHNERLTQERILSDSYLLNLETLEKLHNAEQIVKEYLTKKMEVLQSDQKDAAAIVFQFLVTPGGSKIAYPALELAESTKLDQEALGSLLKTLDDQRIVRSVRLAGDQSDEGYELFHDVLATAVLDWRRQYLQAKELETTKQEQQQRIEEEHRQRVRVIKQGLAMNAIRQHRRGQTELAALLALQAARFNQQEQCHVLDLVDESLRAILNEPYFCNILGWHPSEQPHAISSVAFSSGSENLLAAASLGGPIRLWQLDQPSPPEILDCEGIEVYAIAFSPNGQWLAAGCKDATIRLWDLSATNTIPRILKGHQAAVRAITFSPDGRLLASGSRDATIRLWQLQASEVDILIGHQGGVEALVFSPDGHLLASGSQDKTIKLWQVQTRNTDPLTRYGHEGTVRSLAFSPDGQTLASGSEDSTLRLWDLQQNTAVPRVLQGHQGEVFSVAFHPNGQHLASAGSDQSIKLWDFRQTDQPFATLWGHYSTIHAIAFSPEGHTLISGGKDNMVRLWDLDQPSALPKLFKRHERVIRAIAFANDGQSLASASEDHTVQIWNLNAPDAAPKPLNHPDKVFAVTFLTQPDQTWIASGCADHKVRLWNLQQLDSDPIELLGHTAGVSALAFSRATAMLASSSWDNTIQLWQLEKLEEPPIVLTGHEKSITSVAFSADGILLASASDDCTIRVWNLQNLDVPPKILKDHNGRIWSVAFSPDGQFLASASDDWTVRLWDLSLPQPIDRILGRHNTWVSSVVFSPDGRMLASGSYDRSIKLWNLQNPEDPPITLVNHNQSVTSLAFSPDGQTLASGSYDRTIRLWLAQTETLSDLVRQKMRRNLSLEEWNQLVGKEIDYDCTCPELPPGG